jgi:hypothetical protein
MKRLCFILLALFLAVPAIGGINTDRHVPRILIGLYDSRWESSPRSSQIHRFLEMPANHLGFDIHYYDISKPLPKIDDSIAGIIMWFDSGIEVPDSNVYMDWIENAQKQGKKLLFIENSGISDKQRNDITTLKRWNTILSRIGLQDDRRWYQATYGAHVSYVDKNVVEFERKIQPPLPPLSGMHVLGGSNTSSHLQITLHQGEDNETFDLVTTSPQGGYIAPGYAIFEGDKGKVEVDPWIADPFFLWYVNPFTFLQKSMDMQTTPIPDTTTLDGKRIFYSHIDGDGWNNVSEIPPYVDRAALSSEVIYDQILKPYSDFAFDVALITADVDMDCYGVQDSEKIARDIFALPNVEPASHTYSHPLFWEFFENYKAEMEQPWLDRYPPKPKVMFSLTERWKDKFRKKADNNNGVWGQAAHPDSKPQPKKTDEATQQEEAAKKVKRGSNEASVEFILEKYYDTPRSYACSPFNLKDEIVGSAARVNELSPPGKKMRLVQWSGDTSPFEAAIAMTRTAGLLNINGGDSRFDEGYPSYSFVAPVGILIGKERQIFSSNSNEDTYTDLWTDRFFGYKYLQTTAKNTEVPLRVSPFNIYFHIFSGQKQASLNAVRENLNYARTQNIIRITASDYATIAEGFYTTLIDKLGNNRWSIRNRGNMQTFRFDMPPGMDIDFKASKGVLGENYFQKSLYIALDPAVSDILLSIKKSSENDKNAYLMESTWQISKLQESNNDQKLTFEAQGYGSGIMSWKVPSSGEYLIKIDKKEGVEGTPFEKHITVKEDKVLLVNIDNVAAIGGLSISVQHM